MDTRTRNEQQKKRARYERARLKKIIYMKKNYPSFIN